MPTAGYVWPELTKLHFTDENGLERAEEGTLTGATGTIPCIWIEGDSIHYIDEYLDERYLPFEHIGTDPTQAGFFWAEGDWIHYSAETDADEKIWHTDTYTDTPHSDDPPHTDTPHSDTPPHGDTHTDVDPPHTDSYNDVPHTDGWQDYLDSIHHLDVHTDVPHPATPHSDDPPHTDTPYSDYPSHTDSHTNVDPPHSDNWVDVTVNKPELV